MLVLGAALLAGCGGGEEREVRPATAPPSTPDALSVPIQDAGRARDALVRTVLDNRTDTDPLEFLIARYPALRFGSSSAPADPSGVSTWWTTLDPYDAERPGNPTLFLVAVRDIKGLCAMGAASGVGVYEEGLTAQPDFEPCTAEHARERLGLQAP